MSDSGKGGFSGEAHLLKHEGKKYFLRKCLSQERAEGYLYLYNNLEKHGVFPKLLYGEGKTLLFEYLEGRDCRQEDGMKAAYDVGRIFGLVSQVPVNPDCKLNLDKTFFKDLEILFEKKIIDDIKFDKIKKIYALLRKKVDLKIVFDVSDCIPSNFRFSGDKLYLVDIESVKCRFKGRGIAKAFLRWFKKEEEREMFKKGYSSVAPADFMTKEYMQYSYLYYLVVNTIVKLQDGKNYSENLRDLDKLLAGKLN